MEFHDADAVVDVLVLGEVGESCVDSDGCDAFDDAVCAEVPECEVDVVDVGVDEDSAGKFGVLYVSVRREREKVLVRMVRQQHIYLRYTQISAAAGGGGVRYTYLHKVVIIAMLVAGL